MIRFSARLSRGDFRLEASFTAGAGITALMGPSGSGKTTIIRLIAGLERADEGVISFEDVVLCDNARNLFLPAHRRRIGLVFQDAALFPHLSVKGNLDYGRWFGGKGRIDRKSVIDVLGIGHLLDRRPATLSGGEKQRVAIGRALLASPRLLLMDEPLAALDDARKAEILPFIERLRDEFAIPVLYVTHAVDEVARLADQVVRLDGGVVIADGAPGDALAPGILARQADRFGAISILSATLTQHFADYGLSLLDHPAGALFVPGIEAQLGQRFRIAIPANTVTLAIGRVSQASVRTQLSGCVMRIDRGNGPFALVTIDLAGGDTLKAYITRLAADQLGLDTGDDVLALIKSTTIDERAIARTQD